MVALAGCSSESVDTRHALENFKAQADEVARAVLQGDHKKTADLTHPALLEMMGGSRVIFHCRPHAKRVGTNEDDADVSPKLAANAA